MRSPAHLARRSAVTGPAGTAREWDRFVAESPGADMVQASAWARFKRALGLEPRLVVMRDRGGGIVGGAQVMLRPIGPSVAVAYVARGPLVRAGREDLAGDIVDRVLEAARSAGARAVIVQPPEGGDAVVRALDERSFSTGCPSVAPEATVRLDPRRSDDELLAGMSPMRRRNLRKPVPAGLSIQASEDVATFQALHAATAARQGFRALDLGTLRAQWEALGPDGHCRMLLARQDAVPVAGAWFTSFAGTVTYKIAGWDAEAARRTGATPQVNELIHWTIIRHARASGARSVDLGGVARPVAERVVAGLDLPGEVMNSPARFKLAFGGEVVLFPTPRWALLGPRLHALGGRLAGRVLASPRAERMLARLRAG